MTARERAGVEAFTAIRYAKQLLLADPNVTTISPGGVWETQALGNVRTPYTVITYLGMEPTKTANGTVIEADVTLQVTAWITGLSLLDLLPVVDWFDSVLVGKSGTLSGYAAGYIAGIERDLAVMPPPVQEQGGGWSRQAGNEYRFHIQAFV